MTPATLAEELRDMAADEKAHGDTHTLQVLEESAAILEQVAGADAGCPVVAHRVDWPVEAGVGMRRFYGADEWHSAQGTVEFFGGKADNLIRQADHLAALTAQSGEGVALYEALKASLKVMESLGLCGSTRTFAISESRAAIAAYEAKRGGVR